jgi:hypothetical protein
MKTEAMKTTAMSQEDELRAAISRREAQLDAALKDLVAAAESRASLGHYVGRYPWQFLIGALVAGAWLGRRR